MLARLRKIWLDVHLWLGVGLFIPIAILGLTGSALTYHDELERMLHPARYKVTAGPALPPSALIDAAGPALGDRFQITGVTFPLAADEPAVVQARAKGKPVQAGARPEQRAVYLDPATARVLEVNNPRAGFFAVLHQLHGSFMIPDIGRKIVGWMGWGLLISSLTGIWLWWPRGQFLRGFRWCRGKLFSYNFHHMVGFWISIPLALVAASGIYISFPQSARVVGQFVTRTEIPEVPKAGGGGGGAPLNNTEASIDRVAEIARAAAPDASLARINLPTKSKGKDAPSWRADMRNTAKNQTIQLKIPDAPEAAAKRQAFNQPALAMRRLHDGNDQSPLWRLMVFLSGLAPAVLGVTGIILWLRRNKIAT